MDKETLRIQMLAGIITENEYKAKLGEGKMKKFRFETEVEQTIVFEYEIEANSLEEALEQLRTGEHRGEGVNLRDNIHWETEVITAEEQLTGRRKVK